MKNIKKFKEFIKENVTNLLKPKSEDDILTVLKKYGNNRHIKSVIDNEMSYDLLPRQTKGINKGRCVFNGNLTLNHDVAFLPDYLTVNGNLHCHHSGNSKLTKLPKGLIVKGGLDFQFTTVTEIPDDIKVGHLYCPNNKLTSLPDNLTIDGNLYCYNNYLTELPKGLKVGGELKTDLYCYKERLTELPKKLEIGEDFENNSNLELPKDAEIGGRFIQIEKIGGKYIEHIISN